MITNASVTRLLQRGAQLLLAISVLGALTLSASAALTHRYSFTSDATDSVGAANGTVMGFVTFANNEAVFPGGAIGESYIELPPGLISNYTSVTFEFWCNVGATAQWSEIYAFGNVSATGGTGANMLMFTPNSAGPDYRMSYASADPGYTQEFVATATPVLNNRGPACITCVYDPANNAMTMYRNGVRVALLSPVTAAGVTPQFSLANIYNVYSWLGRSLYSNDGPYTGTLSEFRIYDAPVSALQAAANFKAGPDQVIATPGILQTLSIDATNMNAGASQQAQLLGNFQNINGVPLTPYASNWVSSNPTIIAVDANGLLTSGASSGTTTISAMYDGMTASKEVSVTAVVTSLAMTAPSQMVAGSSRLFKVTATYSDNSTADLTAQCTFSSSDATQLTVITTPTGQKLAAWAVGTPTVTATYQSKQVSKQITVTALSMTHRWSFNDPAYLPDGFTLNTNITDSVGGANGYIIQGAAAASGFDGAGTLLLDGQGGYAEFPQMNLFSDYGAITFEAWVQDNGSSGWARIYDFGNSVGGAGQQGGGTRYMFLSLPSGPGTLRGAYTITGGGAGEQFMETPRPAVGGMSHVVWTSKGAGSLGSLYVNGLLVATNGTMTLTPEDIGLTTNNWLGRAQFNDPPFWGNYDEFRVYNGALDPLSIALNSAAGPNTPNPTPGALNSLQLSITTPMTVGDNQQAGLVGNFANVANVPLSTLGAPTVVYTSSNTNVARISPLGLITAVGPGSTIIKATAFNVSTEQTLSVQDVPVTLTHRWSFSDTPGSGIIADSIGGADGTGQGAFTGNGTEGVFDGANGTYVLLPPDLFIDYNSITFEVWFTDTGTATWGRLIDIGNGTARYMYLDANGPNGNIRAAFNAGAGEDPPGPDNNVITYGGRPPLNVQHHMVFTQDAVTRTAKIWIDGVQVAQNLTFGARPKDVGTTPLSYFGKAQFNDPYYMGRISEIRAYRGAITPAQIAVNYTAGPDNVVMNPGNPGSVTISATNMVAGNLQQARVLANFAGAPNVIVTGLATNWTSSDPAVLKVDQNGLITAIAPGTATVSATYGIAGSTTITVSAAPAAALVHRYSFAADATDSVGGANGTISGSAAVVGGQLVLDGAANSYVTLPAGLLNGLTEVTLEAWFSYATTNNVNSRVWDFGDTTTTNYLGFVPRSGSDNTAPVRYRWSGAPVTEANLNMPGTIGAGAPMTHVVVVLSPANGYAKYYANGVWKESYVWTAPLSAVSNAIAYLGHAVTADAPPANMIGTIDEFRIWNKALDQVQIGASYAAGPNSAVAAPGAPTALSVALTDPKMVLSTKQRPLVSGTFAVGTLDLTGYPGVVLSSSNPSVVAVTPDDQIKALSIGTANITASYGGKSATVAVTVTPKQLTMTHRYSFNGSGKDGVGKADATLYGTASIANNALVLPGIRNPQSHVELPRDIVSGFDALTIEAWTTVDANVGTWQRLWDFGNHQNNAGLDYIYFSPYSGAGSNPIRLGLSANRLMIPEIDADSIPNLRGRTVHIVCTVDEAAGVMKVYTNGVVAGTYSGPLPVKLSSINDVYNYLGRAQFNDNWFKGTIDEFRIYYGAMTDAQVAASFASGTNPDQIAIQILGPNAVISWIAGPMTEGFVLQTTSTLGGAWGAAPGSPVLSGGVYSQSVPLSPGGGFFRLAR